MKRRRPKRTRPPRSAGSTGDARSGWAPGAARWRWPRPARWRALLGGDVELVQITTAGDVDRARGDKSRWVGALESALLAGEIDLAVHSAKDVPGELAAGTAIAATPRRAEPFDVLVGEDALARCARARASGRARCAGGPSCSPPGPTWRSASCAATSTRGWPSARRARSTCSCSRRRALTASTAAREAGAVLTGGVFVPAAGQGVIAVQARAGSPAADAALVVDHAPTHASLDAERHVVRALEATCHTPVGVLAVGGRVHGFVGLPDGSSWLLEEAASGDELARRLLAAGAADLLREADERSPHDALTQRLPP